METLASNVASAFDINYLDVLSKIGITPEIQLVAIEKLLNNIGKELTNSKTVETMEIIWRLMWRPNFSDDIGGNLTSGKYYYLCINNYRLKCIRDKTVELYNMKQTELANQTPLASDVTIVDKKKKVVKTPSVTTTTDGSSEVPVVKDEAPVVEKKKRAPPKKKEAVVESDSVVPAVPIAPTTEVAPVAEKKKRAPAKKKESVVVSDEVA